MAGIGAAFKSNYKTMKAAAQARKGKAIAGGVAKRVSGTSSGAAATRKLSRVTNYVKNNKGKSAMMGGAAVAVGTMVKNRRSSGLNKGKTGMYGY